MRYIGLDFGTKTIGISMSDRTGIIASSLIVLRYIDDYKPLLKDIEKIVKDNNVEGIVLGLPKNMNNTLGERAIATLEFKDELEKYLNCEIILEDERLTTKEANKTLIEANLSRKKRKGVVDKLAASFILQNYLNRASKGE